MLILRWLFPLALILSLAGIDALPAHAADTMAGYIAKLPPESPAERKFRHRRVAERRAQAAVVLCHRGASAFAPENTLEAYAAAMDYGADGCEIDIRRTRDGVLVLFHDDMLDHLTDGFGTVEEITYTELLGLKPRFVYGRATARTRPPTLAAVLALARQRAMLLHLDIKREGLDQELKQLLDAADMWDHVTAINSATGGILLKDPRYQPLPYKGPGLFEQRLDWDPEAVRAQLARPGVGVMVDDPRLVARELKRLAYEPVPIPANLTADWTYQAAKSSRRIYILIAPIPDGWPETKYERDPFGFGMSLRFRFNHEQCFFELMRRNEYLQLVPDSATPISRETPTSRASTREEMLVARAHECSRLASETRSPVLIKRLETLVMQRAMHSDWILHGLDGAMAARALGTLKSQRSVPVLVHAFKRIDPALKQVQDPRFSANPLAWTDFRVKMYILPALGEIRCPESREFLQEYLRMDEKQAKELAPLMWDEATRALLKQGLTLPELVGLLRSPRSAVRGTALQECLDNPNSMRRTALRTAASWATTLPSTRGERP